MIENKLKAAREVLNLSQSEASRLSGLVQKDISLLEAGKKKFIPKEYIHFLYSNGIDINSIYIDEIELKFGNTPNYPLNNNVISEVNEQVAPSLNYEKLHPKLHPTLHPTQKHILPQVVTVDHSGNENVVLVNVKAQAGYLNGYGDAEYIQTLPTYSMPGLKNGTFRAFEVSGDSMYPTLEHKEIVICQWVENTDHIRNDRVHVIVSKKDGIVIKRLLNCISKQGYIIAKSDATNKTLYRNINVFPEDIEEIWYPILHINHNFRSPNEIHNRMNNFESDLEEIKRRLGI